MNLVALKRTPVRVLACVVTVAALAACGQMSPGAAAVVEGETITMDTADQTAAAYCAITVLSSPQGAAGVNSGEMRRQAVADLVTNKVALRVAEEQGVEADPKAYDLTRQQKSQVADTFPDLDPEPLVDAIQGAQQTIALTVALGEEVLGEQFSPQNEQQIKQAGREVIAEAMESMDIAIDDRFGLSDTTTLLSTTGSLSVAVGDEPPAAAPITQGCL